MESLGIHSEEPQAVAKLIEGSLALYDGSAGTGPVKRNQYGKLARRVVALRHVQPEDSRIAVHAHVLDVVPGRIRDGVETGIARAREQRSPEGEGFDQES